MDAWLPQMIQGKKKRGGGDMEDITKQNTLIFIIISLFKMQRLLACGFYTFTLYYSSGHNGTACFLIQKHLPASKIWTVSTPMSIKGL